jgi:Tfp pilus assembly pilus retraction ATPase PilT
MYSMDDLLYLVTLDGAEALWLRVGRPLVIVLDGEQQTIEGPSITPEDAEHLLQNIADSRQRRELREHGEVHFIYRHRHVTDFVVRVRIEDDNVVIEIS